MRAEKYMERAFATIAPSFSASAPELRIVAERVAALCAEIEAETLEACAKLAELHRIGGADKMSEAGNNIACRRIAAAIRACKP